MNSNSSRDYLKSSRAVAAIRSGRRSLFSWIRSLIHRSALPGWTSERADELRAAPLSILSKVLIAAVLTNGLLLVALGRPISALAVAGRGALLLLGWAGLKHKGRWEEVIRGSWVPRKLWKRDP